MVNEQLAYGRYINLEDNPKGYNKPQAVLVDLDGTLALHNGRSPYDFAKCETDLVNEPIKHIVNTYAKNSIIFVVSGRDDWCMAQCCSWLHANNIHYDDIFMRKSGDKRSDDIVKEEIYNTFIRDKYKVRFVLDDRDRVVKKWRELGITCLQVNYGDF